MSTSTTPSRAGIEACLATLRDQPVNTDDNGRNVLAPIYNYLISIPAEVSDGVLHWFCLKADSVTIDAATFLIRLFAYESDNVTTWKRKLKSCLTGCSECVQGLEEVKVTSRHT